MISEKRKTACCSPFRSEDVDVVYCCDICKSEDPRCMCLSWAFSMPFIPIQIILSWSILPIVYMIATVVRTMITLLKLVRFLFYTFLSKNIGNNLRCWAIIGFFIASPLILVFEMIRGIVVGLAIAAIWPFTLYVRGQTFFWTLGFSALVQDLSHFMNQGQLASAFWIIDFEMKEPKTYARYTDVPFVMILVYLGMATVSAAINMVITFCVLFCRVLWYIPAMIGMACCQRCGKKLEIKDEYICRVSGEEGCWCALCFPWFSPIVIVCQSVFGVLLQSFRAFTSGCIRYQPERWYFGGFKACLYNCINTLSIVDKNTFTPCSWADRDPELDKQEPNECGCKCPHYMSVPSTYYEPTTPEPFSTCCEWLLIQEIVTTIVPTIIQSREQDEPVINESKSSFQVVALSQVCATTTGEPVGLKSILKRAPIDQIDPYTSSHVAIEVMSPVTFHEEVRG